MDFMIKYLNINIMRMQQTVSQRSKAFTFLMLLSRNAAL